LGIANKEGLTISLCLAQELQSRNRLT
jgi:hypothetical protein